MTVNTMGWARVGRGVGVLLCAWVVLVWPAALSPHSLMGLGLRDALNTIKKRSVGYMQQGGAELLHIKY